MPMSIAEDTDAYEAWLRTHCRVDEAAIEKKHKRMRESAFVFLRATCYRWSRRIGVLLPELAQAPRVLCVGDLHVENFGTWRDDDGRLVWGVNDFDDAAEMPFVFDLVRLVTSIRLAPSIEIGRKAAADVVVDGYLDGLAHPRPTLPDEHDIDLRSEVAARRADRSEFWSDIHGLPEARPPAAVATALLARIPQGARKVRFASRTAGGGSLGRPRYVLLAQWRGGTIVREAKAIVPSSWDWAHGTTNPSRFMDLAQGEHRSPDPWLSVDAEAGVVVRRLSASSSKIEWKRVRNGELRQRLIRAMGFDLGAIHAMNAKAAKLLPAYLADLPQDWLHTAARIMHHAVEEDFEAWRAR
jgi:hypothetical protein